MSRRKKKERPAPSGELSVDPEARVAAKFDAAGIAKFPVAQPGKMGFRVRDDCAEEHRM